MNLDPIVNLPGIHQLSRDIQIFSVQNGMGCHETAYLFNFLLFLCTCVELGQSQGLRYARQALYY
jgi:hypothetical protein